MWGMINAQVTGAENVAENVAENRKPKTENRKPKTENRKPKTENRKNRKKNPLAKMLAGKKKKEKKNKIK